MDDSESSLITNIVSLVAGEYYSILACYYCGNFCHPPFNHCEKQRLYCADCSMKRNLRPCKTFINLVHLQILEKLHKVSIFPCEYMDEGCNFQARGSDILTHHRKCRYHVITCPGRNCARRYPALEVFNHFERRHPNFYFAHWPNYSQRIFYTELSMEGIALKHIISHCNITFLVKIFVSFRANFIRALSTNLGPFRDVVDYETHIVFKMVNGEVLKLKVNNRFDRHEGGMESLFIRKNIQFLALHEDLYYQHEVLFVPKKPP